MSGHADELRTLFLFERFSDTQLQLISSKGSFEMLPAGPLITEGDPAVCFYVLVDGELVMSARTGGADVQTHRTSQRGVYCGAWNAYVPEAVQRYEVSVRLTCPSRMFVMAAHDFAVFMQTQFPIAVHLLGGHVLGSMRQQQLLGQRMRLLGLGTITAGLTHHLNNPAAAISRAAADLRDAVSVILRQIDELAGRPDSSDSLRVLQAVQHWVQDSSAGADHPRSRSALEIADREDAVADLLDTHSLDDGGNFAAVFADSDLEIAWLKELFRQLTNSTPAKDRHADLHRAMEWLCCVIRTDSSLDELSEASRRISTLLAGAEQYSQMDRGDYQLVDVHELLTSTLLVCAPLTAGGSQISVHRQWDPSLPRIACYAGDLNQVWTGIIDNALDAMGERGTLTVRTARLDPDRIAVAIGNDGPMIAEDIIDNIFTPFFTTKTTQDNVGLGLDLVRRIVDKHCGSISVTSVPDYTEFVISLPVQAPPPDVPLSCDSDGR